MTRFDAAYQALLRIQDILGFEPEEPKRREIQDVLSALEHNAHQRGYYTAIDKFDFEDESG